jgi:hypothetical protein
MALKKKGCIFIVIFSIVLFLLLIALLVFFLYPREPTIQEVSSKFSSFNLPNSFTPGSQFTGTVNTTLEVNNSNYVDIEVNLLLLTIYYQRNNIGYVSEKDKTFPKRDTIFWNIFSHLQTNNPVIVANMITTRASGGSLIFTYKGNVTVTYLKVQITKNIQFNVSE